MSIKFVVKSLGCRLNKYESEEISYELQKAGFVRSEDKNEKVDLHIINSCSVTARTDYKCRMLARSLRRDYPDSKIVITGCYAEGSKEELSYMDEVDLVIGNAQKFELLKFLDKFFKFSSDSYKVDPDPVAVRFVGNLSGRTNGYMKIQTGCDELCTFCLIKVVRGKSCSADPEKIVKGINHMADNGIKEVVLTGVNIADYRFDKLDLFSLLEVIIKRTKIKRIRLSSINPQNIDDRLIDLVGSEKRIMPHFHIPLQSGSDRILKLMKRRYTRSEYYDLIMKINDKIADVGIGADLMVGFPTETEEDFMASYDLVNSLPLMMLHIFPYSRRKRTESYDIGSDIPEYVKKERAGLLKTLSLRKKNDMMSRYIGRDLDLLVESSRSSDGLLKGFSQNYLQIFLKGDDDLKGKIVSSRIDDLSKGILMGSFNFVVA